MKVKCCCSAKKHKMAFVGLRSINELYRKQVINLMTTTSVIEDLSHFITGHNNWKVKLNVLIKPFLFCDKHNIDNLLVVLFICAFYYCFISLSCHFAGLFKDIL